jgi:hypothetical protein
VTKSITLRAYYDMLATHDWAYTKTLDQQHYDDHEPRHWGLQKISALTPQHKALYDQWEHFALTGNPEDKPKPPEAE